MERVTDYSNGVYYIRSDDTSVIGSLISQLVKQEEQSPKIIASKIDQGFTEGYFVIFERIFD